MARNVGGGFASGLLAGTQAASKWIDVYNQAKQQNEVDQAIQMQGNDEQEVGVDYLKKSFGLDDNAANTLLDQLRADPTKARGLLNATNAITGGAADAGAPAKGVDALGAPIEAARTTAIDMRAPQGAALPAAVANPDQISRRYPEAVAGRPTPQQSFATSRGAQLAAIGKELGINPALLGGQFGLETGWGKSVIPGTENLGNIKAGSGYTGRTVTANDKAEGSNDPYRAYDNPESFNKDFVNLIKTRYPGAVGAGDDAEKYFNALKAGGYATDPDYVKKGLGAVEAYRKAGGNLAVAPEQVQAQAVQTPQGQQAMAEDIGDMQRIADRMRIPKNAQFAVGPDGKVTMSTPKSDADRYLRVAQVYLKNGKVGEAKQAMDMHLQTKATEAAEYVKDILGDDSLDSDQKIGALARGTGIRIYKDKDGGYVSPDITGGPGEGGKHKRLSMADIAQYANLMTTPEGMKMLYAHQLEQQKANNQSRTVALQERQEGTATTPGSQARLREAQANYYDQRPDLQLAAIQARAAAGGKNTDKGDVTTVQPDQTYAVNVPSGPDGKAETRQMQLFSPPAGVSGGTGLMDSSQVSKLPDILKAISKSPYGDPQGEGVRIGVQANPVQYDPGTKNLTSHAGQLSGQYTFPVTMTNPATGQREAVAWLNGKPVWASESSGRVPMYRTPEQAEAAAKALQEYFIKQKQPEVNAERAASKEALDKASAVRVPPRGIHARKTKKEE